MRPPTPPGAPPELREDVVLGPYTTLGIGGPARWLVEAPDPASVGRALEWSSRHDLPLLVLGGGSNVLIADEGFPGLVLRPALRGIVEEAAGGSVLVRVAAGEDWDALVARSVQRGLAGLECLSGIPGLAGATPIQNVGAYGREVSTLLVEVEAMSRHDGGVRRFVAAECGFAYRTSVFKGAQRDRWVVLGVTFRLQPGGEGLVAYPELARELREASRRDPAVVREAVLALRRRKGMVLDADDPDTRSDGSFFLNPVLAPERVADFLGRARAAGHAPTEVPQFPAPGGAVKLSAAWLIEHAGYTRGHRHGAVGLSSKHALAIVNRGGGTAAEVRDLAVRIRGAVADRFGVVLEPEPLFVGLELDGA
jgi:UDP-N-acetylmuramate dehydrogenase